MNCPKCGAPHAPDAKFCGQCGLALVANVAAATSTAASASATSSAEQAAAAAQAAQPSAAETAATATPRPALAVATAEAFEWVANTAMTPLTPRVAIQQPKRTRRTLAKWIIGIIAFIIFINTIFSLLEANGHFLILILAMVAAATGALFYAILIFSLGRFEMEPWRAVLAAFVWGATGAVFLAGIINTFTNDSAVFGAPEVEETLKGLGLLGLVWIFRKDYDNVLDGLVYGGLIGVGFAMVENVGYFLNAFNAGGPEAMSVNIFIRLVLGGFGHAFYTGITGAAIGWALSHPEWGPLRYVVVILGWMGAVLMHTLWNALSLLVILLDPLGGVLVLYFIARAARNRGSRIIKEQLTPEVEKGLLTQQEYVMLYDRKARKSASRAALRYGGLGMWLLQRQFFEVASHLAFRKYHLSRGEKLKGEQKETSEEEYLAQLGALRTKLISPVPPVAPPPPQPAQSPTAPAISS